MVRVNLNGRAINVSFALFKEQKMISAGELYDLTDEIRRTGILTEEQQLDLIDECHRLRHLIEEMADFRASKQHNELIKTLKEIRTNINN